MHHNRVFVVAGMDEDGAQDSVSGLEGRSLGGWELLQIAGGTGLVAYSVWALVLMPGFRKVPLKLQASCLQSYESCSDVFI